MFGRRAKRDVQRPQKIIDGDTFVLKDKTREVQFLFLGWGHTPGDGYVWLPKERVLVYGGCGGEWAEE